LLKHIYINKRDNSGKIIKLETHSQRIRLLLKVFFISQTLTYYTSFSFLIVNNLQKIFVIHYICNSASLDFTEKWIKCQKILNRSKTSNMYTTLYYYTKLLLWGQNHEP
jgi:hypothetical protein